MTKTKIAGVAGIALLIVYSVSLIRDDRAASDAHISSSSAALYESCQTRNQANDDLGLGAEREDCAALLLDAN